MYIYIYIYIYRERDVVFHIIFGIPTTKHKSLLRHLQKRLRLTLNHINELYFQVYFDLSVVISANTYIYIYT